MFTLSKAFQPNSALEYVRQIFLQASVEAELRLPLAQDKFWTIARLFLQTLIQSTMPLYRQRWTEA